MNKKKIVFFSLSIVILMILLLSGRIIKIKNIDIFNINKEQINEISYQVYSNQNDIIKVLVTIYEENGIKNIKYLDNQKELNPLGKQTIAIDLIAEIDKKYTFFITKSDDSVEEKEITITQEDLNNVIKIDITSETGFGTEADLSIKYEDYFKYKEYKIGTTGNWESYTEDILLDSYSIINKKLYNADNTLTIYVRGRDDANNIVEFSRQVDCLDFDIPEQPVIASLGNDNYPIITQEGVSTNCEVSLTFDTRNDITNYYSADNINWYECTTETIEINSHTVYAKSVKNDSGLTSYMKVTKDNTLKSDAIGSNGYDNDSDTYYTQSGAGSTRYMYIDETMYNKKVNIYFVRPGTQAITMTFYNGNDESIESLTLLPYSSTGTKIYNSNVTIPESATKFRIHVGTWALGGYIQIYNISPVLE